MKKKEWADMNINWRFQKDMEDLDEMGRQRHIFTKY